MSQEFAAIFGSNLLNDLFLHHHAHGILLGRLIIASKLYRNVGQHIAKLLSLNPPDAIYHNVMDFLGSNLTALQAAVFIQEYRQGHSATNDILQAILRKITDPEYLNLQVQGGPWDGKTAVHLAIESSNLDAVQYLIDAKGSKLGLGCARQEWIQLD